MPVAGRLWNELPASILLSSTDPGVYMHPDRNLPFLLLLLVFTGPTLFGQKYFEWSPLLKDAYHQTLSLRFKAAEETLTKARRTEPDNLIILHVENYLDFFRVYINEDKSEFDRLERRKNERLNTISNLGDPRSPYYLFLQADIRLQWALARLKFEEFMTAFFETNKAFKLLVKNAGQFPEFMPNKKDLGILHAMAGTIPDNYRWAMDWFTSLEGTIDQGRGELEEVIRYAEGHDFIYEQEIYVYYAYLMLHLGNDSEEAWRIVSHANLEPSSDPIACFVMANVAMRSDKGDEAIRILAKKPAGDEFHPFYYLDYMMGLAKLQRLDPDAGTYLNRFVSEFKGRNFIKDAYQKLGWIALLNNDPAGYRQNMDHCKNRGFAIVGSDKSALEESMERDIPAVDLLKARLLFDGGRFDAAYKILQGKHPDDYFSERNRLEFLYRMGRITQKLKKYQEALSCFQQTIERGKDRPWYFACRAALEEGHIYEVLGNQEKAIEAFERCQTINPEDHKTGLHQQAKAGIRRLKK